MSWSIESGNDHECVCGATWYDSDGGPCHDVCSADNCSEIIPSGDNSIPQQWGMCCDCFVSTLQDNDIIMKEFIEYGSKIHENKAMMWNHVKDELDEWFGIMQDVYK